MSVKEWADTVLPLPLGVTSEDVARHNRRAWLDKVAPIPRDYRR